MSGGFVGRPHVVVAVDLHQPDRAELSFSDHPVARADEVRRTSTLHPHLDDPFVLARRGQHRLSFDHVYTDRLLDPHVESPRTASIIGNACQ